MGRSGQLGDFDRPGLDGFADEKKCTLDKVCRRQSCQA